MEPVLVKASVRSVLFALIFLGCAAPDTSRIKLIGHGGLGPHGEHPMDSRAAVIGALASGLDGVELDLQMTKDHVLVAFHDLELDASTDCHGPVHSRTWEELRTCPNVAHAGVPYPIVRVDSFLIEVAGLYPGTEFTLDIKLNTKGEWWPYLHAFNDALIDLATRPELTGRILIECQTEDFLRLLHTEAPELPLFLYGTDAGTAAAQALGLGCSGITLDANSMSKAEIALARERGLQTTLFGVSGAWELRNAVDLGPDRIQVDHPH
ncbi:MAG: hypothetical protein JNL43_01865 [Flavobacteriales bacterium]|nr:hypothetical protein [Flavobacteriales bacterium]